MIRFKLSRTVLLLCLDVLCYNEVSNGCFNEIVYPIHGHLITK